MFINEVCNIVGLSRKSIRYYEENGLLSPKRNTENDYRIYTEEDIQKLKTIKFLRELDVPIRELKMLNEGTLTLQECMESRIYKIREQEEKYQKVKEMCVDIKDSNATLDSIDITKHFQSMNTLNKEGFTMRDVRTNKRKKILGAILSSFLFSILFIFLAAIITYFQVTEADKIPWLVYAFLMFLFGFPIVGIIVNLVNRIREINGGEEDEASKY